MKSQGITANFSEANVDALVVAVFKDEKVSSGILKDLDKLTGGIVASVFKGEDFKGDMGETALIRFAAKGKGASRLLLIGVGDKNDYKVADVSNLAGTATRFLRKRNSWPPSSMRLAFRFRSGTLSWCRHRRGTEIR